MVTLKTPDEIKIMAEAGRRLGAILKEVAVQARPGVTTEYLDAMCLRLIKGCGAKPAFLGYKPTGARKAFPATLCASVNEVVVHGLPSEYALRPGDIVGLDLGLIYKGYYADSAVTVGIEPVSKNAQDLIRVAKEALEAGIRAAEPGGTLGDIGEAIYRVVKKNSFSAVESLSGHGIGRALHEDPYVFNVGRSGDGMELVPGMVIAIEPMVSAGSGKVRTRADDSYVTSDNSLSAHFEHTVAITEKGPVVLTAFPKS